jgi:hypothetical protein
MSVTDCFAIIRYGDKDGEDVACSAMQLACGHLIGSECLKAITRVGTINCPYCLAPLEIANSPVPRIVRWLAGTSWAKSSIDNALLLGEIIASGGRGRFLGLMRLHSLHRPNHHIDLTRLIDGLFAQTLTIEDAVTLWFHLNKLVIIYKLTLLVLLLLGFYLPSHILCWIYGTYIEILPLSLLSGSLHSGSLFGMGDWASAVSADIALTVLCYVLPRSSAIEVPFLISTFAVWRSLELCWLWIFLGA